MLTKRNGPFQNDGPRGTDLTTKGADTLGRAPLGGGGPVSELITAGSTTAARPRAPAGSSPLRANEDHRWAALFITTLGMLMATIDASIVLIALPDIFRGIHLDPLLPSNTFFLLWMILGFLIVTSVLVVSLGRLGDLYGRVRIYNLGFAVFTFFSLLLSITWMTGTAAGIWLIVMRIFQGVGAAMLMANSAAILTDAFPPDRRGFALGINQAAAISGTFIGLLLGGLLAPINWRLIFLVSVPIGLFATIWGYFSLHEVARGSRARIDWAGNVTFAIGLILVMVGITYGIEPYGDSSMGWTNPTVLLELGVGVAFLILFCFIEVRTDEPMFRLQLFKIRAFSAGVFASFLGALGRGGLMFMLIIWLQGIWLPRHGYTFAVTPLWAGIFMIPLTTGFLIGGPISGILSDRYGSRPFATGGMLGSAVAFFLLEQVPVDFSYSVFGILLFFMGLVMSSFGASNRTGVMNSLPASDRGAGSGMNTTFQNFGASAVHRDLLHSDHRGPVRPPAGRPGQWPHCARRAAGNGAIDLASPAGLDALRRIPRIQPGGPPSRPPRARPTERVPTLHHHRRALLSRPHHEFVQGRPAHRLQLRHRHVSLGGGLLVDPRREGAGPQ